MDVHKREEVANDCLSKAKSYAALGNYKRAFPHYLMCFELLPDVKHNYEEEFQNVLFHLGVWFEEIGLITDLCKYYIQGIQYFPSNSYMLNNFGSHLLRLNQPETALEYLELAYGLNKNFLPIEKNLQTAKLDIIPRWHFRMLNDSKRNEAYRKAIHNTITPQHNKVLDVGSGCGLLSFYTSECEDVQSIVAVESCDSLCKIACQSLKDISIIRIINKHSTELSSADIGLSNLLVTETFDAGLFGEHVLETLIHAWENLLEPSAKIIPNGADLFVTGINSNSILSRHKFCHNIPQLNLANICIRQLNEEPYEAENLKQKSVKYITNTEKAISINFNDLQQLKCIYNSVNAIPSLSLKCLESGTIDAFVVWFNLYLNENVTITTNPTEDNVKCWEQAVVYLNHPITVKQDQEIKLHVSCVNNKLNIDVSDLAITCQHCHETSQNIITFLNDAQIVKAANDLEFPTRFNKRHCEFLDLNPFPLFALIRAKKGFAGHYRCVAETEFDYRFIDFVWRKNGFSCIDDVECNSTITYKVLYVDELESSLLEKSLDVIFVNPVSKNGTLNEEIFNDLKSFSIALKEDGLILPNNIKLQVELIDSEYLDFCNKVEDTNLLGFKVADLINRFAVLEQWQVEPLYYHRKTLCSFIAECNNLTASSVDYNVEVPISGKANGVLYWYCMEYLGNLCINTYESLHYSGACFLFEHPREVKPNETVQISIKQQKGYLKICCHDLEDMIED